MLFNPHNLNRFLFLSATLFSAFLGSPQPGFSQAPGVPIIRDRGETSTALVEAANGYREAGSLLDKDHVTEQLQRTSVALQLPRPARKEMRSQKIWEHTRLSHVRVGWHFLCNKCEHWHQNLAGGYFITADGVMATCYHVVAPNAEHREAYLVAATEAGEVFPVVEVLAANERTDTALLRLKITKPVQPLPLNTNVTPGDAAWCYSDPLGRKSYFSHGMINRFYYHPRERAEVVRMEVSTDWAPGSSGAAIVDQCGNAIGHVSEISSGSVPRARTTNQTARASSSLIVFHSAVRAADVLTLIKAPSKPAR